MQTRVSEGYFEARSYAAWIDRTEEIGLVAVSGPDRFSWLQGLVSNDVRPLERGQRRQLACFLTPTGQVATDVALISVREGDLPGLSDCLLLDVPKENLHKTLSLLDRYLVTEDVAVQDVTGEVACLSVQGPEAPAIQLSLRADGLWVEADHTGSGGLDLYIPSSERERVLDAVDIPLLDSETVELLRIEAGIPRYGAELSESVLALEAGLLATHISLNKGCYIGQEIVARIESRGHINRTLTGLLFEHGDVPARGARLYSIEGDRKEVGWISSRAASSPAKEGRPIALAYVRCETSLKGARKEPLVPYSRLYVESIGKEAEVVSLPFYTPTEARR